jgi:uncharacterized membrane protein YfcA
LQITWTTVALIAVMIGGELGSEALHHPPPAWLATMVAALLAGIAPPLLKKDPTK